MNAFVRQTAVLSVLWSVCEMLLPEGRTQQMVRMTAGLLVMTAILSSAGTLLSQTAALPAWTQETVRAGEANYRRIVLKSMANQTAAYCEDFAGRAGYAVEAVVWLQESGAVERVELTIHQEKTSMMTKEEMLLRLGRNLNVQPEKIRLVDPEAP